MNLISPTLVNKLELAPEAYLSPPCFEYHLVIELRQATQSIIEFLDGDRTEDDVELRHGCAMYAAMSLSRGAGG